MGRTDCSKSTLRTDRLAAVRDLDGTTREEASARIRERIGAIDAVCKARCILGFAPLDTEPDIAPLLESLRERGCLVLLPRTIAGTCDMEAVELTGSIADLEQDEMGVRIPRGSTVIDRSEIDLALIPGVAFDHRGNRLGRGGGFYDRFLASAPQLNTIGVCFDLQLIKELPIEAHDRQVDHVSTERCLLADL